MIRLTAAEGEASGHWVLPVLWEDEHLLVLDKPSGLAVRPTAEHPEVPTLLALLHDGVEQGARWAVERSLGFLGTPQRVDAEASGAVVLARSKTCWTALANQFALHLAPESVVALAEGSAEETFAIDAPLARRPTPAGFYRLDARRGRKAETHCTVLETIRGYVLLRCQPIGGRPQQVRAHLRRRGLRVVGDPLYGGRPLLLSRIKPGYRFKPDQEERPLLGRPAIHIEGLKMAHPVSGEPIEVQSPWPKDFEVSLRYLRRFLG